MRGRLATMRSFLDSGWALIVGFAWLFVIALGWHTKSVSWLIKAIGKEKMAKEVQVGTPSTLADKSHVQRLGKVVVVGRRRDQLIVHKAYNPWRIWYPIHLFNGAPIAVDVVGYNLNLLLDEEAIARVTWRAPDSEASNGIPLLPNHDGPVPAYTIQPGQPYTLSVPISRRQIASLPKGNPKWGARGNVYLRSNGEEQAHSYDFATDAYELEQFVWAEWANQ